MQASDEDVVKPSPPQDTTTLYGIFNSMLWHLIHCPRLTDWRSFAIDFEIWREKLRKGTS